MKSAGLSSKFRKGFTKLTKTEAFSNLQEIHLGAKEKQKSLRLQAQQAEQARAKRAADAEVVAANAESKKEASTPILKKD